MPSGVYLRKPGSLVGKHERSSEYRKKVADSVRKIMETKSKDPEWRKRVSEGTKRRMHDPEVRERHLEGLKRAHKNKPFGAPFSGTYAPEPNELERSYSWLVQLGYVNQFVVVKGKRGVHYTLDYALPEEKICIEIDGSSHKYKIESDAKRDYTLKLLGWKIIRVRHWI